MSYAQFLARANKGRRQKGSENQRHPAGGVNGTLPPAAKEPCPPSPAVMAGGVGGGCELSPRGGSPSPDEPSSSPSSACPRHAACNPDGGADSPPASVMPELPPKPKVVRSSSSSSTSTNRLPPSRSCSSRAMVRRDSPPAFGLAKKPLPSKVASYVQTDGLSSVTSLRGGAVTAPLPSVPAGFHDGEPNSYGDAASDNHLRNMDSAEFRSLSAAAGEACRRLDRSSRFYNVTKREPAHKLITTQVRIGRRGGWGTDAKKGGGKRKSKKKSKGKSATGNDAIAWESFDFEASADGVVIKHPSENIVAPQWVLGESATRRKGFVRRDLRKWDMIGTYILSVTLLDSSEEIFIAFDHYNEFRDVVALDSALRDKRK